MPVIALDIGGANLKIADGLGYAASDPFALWKSPGELADRLRSLLAAAPAHDQVAVTMTGELCDCFQTKARGVAAILDAVERAADAKNVAVYLSDGRFSSTTDARNEWQLAAASNWHALASFAGRLVSTGAALLVDVGSTTTDLIPLRDGRPAARGTDDTGRLANGELVYTGVERTPVCAAVREVPYRSQMVPVAAEFFATTGDAYCWLGLIPEVSWNCDTADGRPRTSAASRARLARMICADVDSFGELDATRVAEAVQRSQVLAVATAGERVLASLASPAKTVILSGQGELLGHAVTWELSRRLNWSFTVIPLSKELGPWLSQCAPAHALAVLAREWRMEP